MIQVTEYKNGTAFFVIAKQSDGSTYELNPGMIVKSDNGTHFTALKYPAISNKWYKLHPDKIRMY